MKQIVNFQVNLTVNSAVEMDCETRDHAQFEFLKSEADRELAQIKKKVSTAFKKSGLVLQNATMSLSYVG